MHDARRGRRVAAAGAVAVLVLGLDRELERRASDDPDTVRPALLRRRPVGRDVVGDAGEVLDDDPRPAADPALHLEAKGTLGARREGPEAVRDVACERSALHVLADLVEREPEPARDEPDLSAPHHLGTPGATIGGTSSSGCPNPTR